MTSRRAFPVQFVMIAILALGLSMLSSPASAQSGHGERFRTIASEIGKAENCWSCKIYEEVFKGLRRLVNASYGYFTNGQAAPSPLDCAVSDIGLTDNVQGVGLQDTNGGSSGTSGSSPSGGGTSNSCAGHSASGSAGGAIALVTTILAIVLMFKFVPIAIGTSDPRETGASVRMFLVRVAVVYGIFLSATSAAYMENGIISDFFVDGPLAAGSEIGKELANSVAQALNMSSAQLTATSGSNFAEMHVAATKELLGKIHSLGAAGIVTGVWLMLEGGSQLVSANFLTALAVLIVGFAMLWMFFMFTVSFGLRYIDALVRSMMIFALLPVFAVLWIFDSTRDIAIRAIKGGLALAAVFAVSGVVFMLAVFIMQQGFSKAFSIGGNGGMQTSNLTDAALAAISSGGFSFLQGQAGTATALNWLSCAYLMGCGALAIACARMAFDIAGQIFSLGRAETGVGREMEGRVEGGLGAVASQGGSMVTGIVKR